MHRTSYSVALVGLVAIAMLLCAGCTSTPSGNATPTGTAAMTGTPVPTAGNTTSLPTSTPDANVTATVAPNQTGTGNATPEFIGTTWEWTATETMDGVNQTVVNDSAAHTIVFNKDGSYGITADCNIGGGNYTVNGSALNLTSPITTLIWCGNESHEQLYLASLQNVTAYSVTPAGKLQLALGETGNRMVFAANTTKPSVTVNASFVNKTWRWTGLTATMPASEVRVSNPNQYTINFSSNGTYAIKADCNSGMGNYTLNKTVLKISTPTLTKVYCGDSSLDKSFLAGLTRVKSFQTDANGGLVLTMENPTNRMTFKL